MLVNNGICEKRQCHHPNHPSIHSRRREEETNLVNNNMRHFTQKFFILHLAEQNTSGAEENARVS